MVNLAGQMSWLSIPGCLVSGSALVGCFVWRRSSDRLPPAFVLMNVIGLALSIVGTTWLARVHSFAPNLEPDGASVLGLNSCQFGKPVISVCKQCVSPENLT